MTISIKRYNNYTTKTVKEKNMDIYLIQRLEAAKNFEENMVVKDRITQELLTILYIDNGDLLCQSIRTENTCWKNPLHVDPVTYN